MSYPVIPCCTHDFWFIFVFFNCDRSFSSHQLVLVETDLFLDKLDAIRVDMGVVLKVLVLSVVFDDLWYAKMTFGES